LARWPASEKIFSRADGTTLREGDRLIQTDLAATLAAIADQGPRGFYQGQVAARLAKAVSDAGGIMTSDDLKAYRALIRAPIRGSYRGYDIVAMPISKDYAAKQCASIDLDRATPWTDALSATLPHEGSNTTHFSVVDADGNAVSNTYTLNFSYGVGLVAEGTGVLLNNELDDFTAAPGAANAFGLVGFEANLPGPGKRPLSSMSPTIVLRDSRPVLVTGSPGGSRIISTVLQVILNVLDYHMDVASAVAAPRLHHQWLPDEVRIEHGFPDDVIAGLRAKGHTVIESLGYSSANSIAVTPDGIFGAPDPRTRGAFAAGE